MEGYLFIMAAAVGTVTGYLLERMQRNVYLLSTLAERVQTEHFEAQRRHERQRAEIERAGLEREREMDESTPRALAGLSNPGLCCRRMCRRMRERACVA